MRVWTKVWIAIAAVCVAASIYEIPNAVRVWRFTRGTMRADRHTGSGKLNIPALVRTVAQLRITQFYPRAEHTP
jgi:hypothetical protein